MAQIKTYLKNVALTCLSLSLTPSLYMCIYTNELWPACLHICTYTHTYVRMYATHSAILWTSVCPSVRPFRSRMPDANKSICKLDMCACMCVRKNHMYKWLSRQVHVLDHLLFFHLNICPLCASMYLHKNVGAYTSTKKYSACVCLCVWYSIAVEMNTVYHTCAAHQGVRTISWTYIIQSRHKHAYLQCTQHTYMVCVLACLPVLLDNRLQYNLLKRFSRKWNDTHKQQYIYTRINSIWSS